MLPNSKSIRNQTHNNDAASNGFLPSKLINFFSIFLSCFIISCDIRSFFNYLLLIVLYLLFIFHFSSSLTSSFVFPLFLFFFNCIHTSLVFHQSFYSFGFSYIFFFSFFFSTLFFPLPLYAFKISLFQLTLSHFMTFLFNFSIPFFMCLLYVPFMTNSLSHNTHSHVLRYIFQISLFALKRTQLLLFKF